MTRTWNSTTWRRHASRRKQQKETKEQKIEQNHSTPITQSVIMAQMLGSHASDIAQSAQLSSLDDKLSELDTLIKQREMAYQTYMDELEREMPDPGNMLRYNAYVWYRLSSYILVPPSDPPHLLGQFAG